MFPYPMRKNVSFSILFSIVLLNACSTQNKLVTQNNYKRCSLSIQNNNEDVTPNDINTIRNNIGCNILEDTNPKLKVIVQKPSEEIGVLKPGHVLKYKNLKTVSCPLYNGYFSKEFLCFEFQTSALSNPKVSNSPVINTNKIVLFTVKDVDNEKITSMLKGHIDNQSKIQWDEMITPNTAEFSYFTQLFLEDEAQKATNTKN